MLITLGGLPAVGKTTLARKLASYLKATYLRIDSIEQAIKNSVPKINEVINAGYLVGYALAKENLALGQTVIADSVNPIIITREAWAGVANAAKKEFVAVEIICSDQSEHQTRVNTRKTDIVGLALPSWEAIIGRQYEVWKDKHITIDTAGKTVEYSFNELCDKLQSFIK